MGGKNQYKNTRLIFAMLFAFILVVGVLGGCNKGEKPVKATKAGTEKKLDVVATTNIAADVVRQVGGERINLHTLIPAGSDPHSYEPKPSDFSRMADADVVFMNGAGLEEFMNRAVGKIISGSNVVSLSKGLKLRESPVEKGEKDPHVWFYPGNVEHWVEKIAEKLEVLDPAGRDYYEKRKDSYLGELEKLDSWVREKVSDIPKERRLLITDHLFMGYFADAYGFEVVGAVFKSETTASEPSARDISKLVDLMKKKRIGALFVGINGNKKVAEEVAVEAGAKVVPIYTGTLDAPGGKVDSYVKLVKYDVERIVENLK